MHALIEFNSAGSACFGFEWNQFGIMPFGGMVREYFPIMKVFWDAVKNHGLSDAHCLFGVCTINENHCHLEVDNKCEGFMQVYMTNQHENVSWELVRPGTSMHLPCTPAADQRNSSVLIKVEMLLGEKQSYVLQYFAEYNRPPQARTSAPFFQSSVCVPVQYKVVCLDMQDGVVVTSMQGSSGDQGQHGAATAPAAGSGDAHQEDDAASENESKNSCGNY